MVAPLALLVLLSLATDPPPIDCQAVKAAVAEHGRAKAIYWARAHGYSWGQIIQAKRVCNL